MFEIEINGAVYPLRFGMGFLREINKTMSTPIKNLPGAKKDIGLTWYMAQVMDGDVESLSYVILLANKTEEPRLTKSELEAWLESEDTDIEAVFELVMGFFERSNVTKRALNQMKKAIENQEPAGMMEE